MNFIKRSNLKGEHALLGASKFNWLNYDDQRIIDYFYKCQASARGTELHEFAAQCIRLKQKLPKAKKTLNMYVNDALGYQMSAEQVLYYSENCFGTADAICFRDNMLRIHDLKTGTTIAHMEQLKIYAALFCLEYKYKPSQIDIELRIYQSNQCLVYVPDPVEIDDIIKKIIVADKIINKLKSEEV